MNEKLARLKNQKRTSLLLKICGKKYLPLKRLKGKQLEIVKQLAAWREITARERNRPRKWILADHAMIEMVKGSFEINWTFYKIDKVDEKTASKDGDALLKIINAEL